MCSNESVKMPLKIICILILLYTLMIETKSNNRPFWIRNTWTGTGIRTLFFTISSDKPPNNKMYLHNIDRLWSKQHNYYIMFGVPIFYFCHIITDNYFFMISKTTNEIEYTKVNLKQYNLKYYVQPALYIILLNRLCKLLHKRQINVYISIEWSVNINEKCPVLGPYWNFLWSMVLNFKFKSPTIRN